MASRSTGRSKTCDTLGVDDGLERLWRRQSSHLQSAAPHQSPKVTGVEVPEIGRLGWQPALERLDLLAAAVRELALRLT